MGPTEVALQIHPKLQSKKKTQKKNLENESSAEVKDDAPIAVHRYSDKKITDPSP